MQTLINGVDLLEGGIREARFKKNVYVMVWKEKATGECSFDYAMDTDITTISVFTDLKKAKDRMWEPEEDLTKLLAKHPDFVEDGSYVVKSARLSVE